ncbi:hypothetical protein SBA1_800028 [Candidatus Sulfotelmatobacter kueseliae]|uniref:Uncharacterized protein n=1 Tax=Candidatus Sulfotelmatobacter kueseliae TaxID=2042962 RepID=A0A2U3L8N2_9BACT|nr:hypothetical protein SBA1_800028 [Candidatus Sulfotelmatobacter kueseliae]
MSGTRFAETGSLWSDLPYPTFGSLAIQFRSGQELSPTHASLRSKIRIMIASSNSLYRERAAQSIYSVFDCTPTPVPGWPASRRAIATGGDQQPHLPSKANCAVRGLCREVEKQSHDSPRGKHSR